MRAGSATIDIVLADDHELLRDGFKNMLKKLPHLRLVAEVANGKQLCEAVGRYRPQVVITDIKMPLVDGVEATKFIKSECAGVKVIALTNYDEQELIFEMIQAGADGYLVKTASKKEIMEAITTVLNGKVYYCDTTSQKLLTHLNDQTREVKKEPEIKLTRRELEVMRLICKGYSQKEIGNELGISPRTVETHKESIQEKIGERSTVRIAIFAVQHGYL